MTFRGHGSKTGCNPGWPGSTPGGRRWAGAKLVLIRRNRLSRALVFCCTWTKESPLTRPTGTLSPGERRKSAPRCETGMNAYVGQDQLFTARATPPDLGRAHWGLAGNCQLDPSHPAFVTGGINDFEPCRDSISVVRENGQWFCFRGVGQVFPHAESFRMLTAQLIDTVKMIACCAETAMASIRARNWRGQTTRSQPVARSISLRGRPFARSGARRIACADRFYPTRRAVLSYSTGVPARGSSSGRCGCSCARHRQERGPGGSRWATGWERAS